LLLFGKERAAFFHCQLCQLLPDRSGHHVLELYSKAAVQRKEIHYTSEQKAYSFSKQRNVSKLMRGSYWSAYKFHYKLEVFVLKGAVCKKCISIKSYIFPDMSLDIKESCSLQILISLTTVVWPGYCHLKSEVAALDWCHVFWFDASPSTDLPITESVVLRHSGCQLFSSYHSCRYKRVSNGIG